MIYNGTCNDHEPTNTKHNIYIRESELNDKISKLLDINMYIHSIKCTNICTNSDSHEYIHIATKLSLTALLLTIDRLMFVCHCKTAMYSK